MKKTCDICGGSGQTGHFQGVSRFVITWEECTECNGTGIIDTDDTQQVEEIKRDKIDSSASPPCRNINNSKS